MNIILDKSFVSYQFDLVGYCQNWGRFLESRSNEFSNSLYVYLGTWESYFSFSSIRHFWWNFSSL